MKLRVKLERNGASQDVVVTPLAFIGWERASGRRMSDLAKGGMGMGDLAQLTMAQLKLEGEELELDDIEGFLKSIDDITPESDDPKALAEVAIDAPSLS